MSLQGDTAPTPYLASASASPPSSEVEEATLITHLRTWGISYLTGGLPAQPSTESLDLAAAPIFLLRLTRCPNARVRDAVISLLLLHPELAGALLSALPQSAPQEAEQLSVLILATLYLQRLWWDRLTLALGHPPAVPEESFAALWRARHLPSPAAFCGRWGLLALERAEQQRTGLPLTFTGDWQNQLSHLLHQEEAKHRPAPAGFVLAASTSAWCDGDAEEEALAMSMRPNVDRQAIEHFLTELGRRFRQDGRLYLVGGAALVHAGIRPGSSATTQDIDLEVASGDMYQIIQQLKGQLNINVEFASPRDYLPLPHNWQSLSRYVGRYGTIDVFYFDFYSLALSKIARANSRDLQDVVLLLQQQVITLADLDRAAQEVAAQMGKGHYKRFDPNDFLARYNTIRQHLHP
jgi:hypothetical protein